MANRTIQQKIVKERARMRRAYLKPFSQKRAGPDPNSLGFIQVSKDDFGQPVREFVSMGIGARNKAAQNIESEWLALLFKPRDLNHPDKIYVRVEDSGKKFHMVLARIVQSQSHAGVGQREAPFVCQKLMDTKVRKLYLFMKGDENFFVERLEVPSEGYAVVRRSICYSTKQRCLYLYQQDMKQTSSICWVEKVRTSLPKDAQNST